MEFFGSLRTCSSQILFATQVRHSFDRFFLTMSFMGTIYSNNLNPDYMFRELNRSQVEQCQGPKRPAKKPKYSEHSSTRGIAVLGKFAKATENVA